MFSHSWWSAPSPVPNNKGRGVRGAGYGARTARFEEGSRIEKEFRKHQDQGRWRRMGSYLNMDMFGDRLMHCVQKRPKCFMPLILGILVKARIHCWLLMPYLLDCFKGVMCLDLFSKSFFLTSKVRVLGFSFDCWSCSFYLRNPIGIFKLQFAPDKWLSHILALSMDSDF